MRIAALAVIVATIIAQVTLAIDAARPKQYQVDSKLKQAGQGVITAPKLQVSEGREAYYLVGDEATLGDETIPRGMQVKFRIKRADDGEVVIAGTIEVSQTIETSDSAVSRKSTCLHFKKTTPLAQPLHLSFSDPTTDEGSHELTVTIEEVK